MLVEDSRVYQRLVVGHLRDWGFNVSMVNDGAKAWEMLQQKDSPKLVLLDWSLPGMDGLELCRKLRARPSSDPYVYTILLTSKEGRSHLLEAMEAGVDDYLVKPFDELELKARLLAGTRILRLHDELIAARETMRHAATHDGLTELMNRTAFSNCWTANWPGRSGRSPRSGSRWPTSTTSRPSMTKWGTGSETMYCARWREGSARSCVFMTESDVWAGKNSCLFFPGATWMRWLPGPMKSVA